MVKKFIKYFYKKAKWKGKGRIFCISSQRTGTTSVGNFFKHFGYPTASWGVSDRNKWSKKWYDGDFDAIFNSFDFKSNQVFEDDPWWLPDFYKVLYHKFPNSKFILFTRNSEDWFKSMVKHSKGQSLGNTLIHSKAYRRELEVLNRMQEQDDFNPTEDSIDNLLDITQHEDHYKALYELRHREIKEFFNSKDPNALLVCDLNDPEKWKKIGQFVGINVPSDFDMHSNKSN